MNSATKGISTKYRHMKLEVFSNRKVFEKHYLLTVKLPEKPEIDITPGQFFHVICDPEGAKKNKYPLTLRRPFSVHRINSPKIEFLYRVAGRGTEMLSSVKAGVLLDAIGPCGNGFTIGKEHRAVIVAGGIGIAPLIALVERLRDLNKEVYFYFGALKKEQLKIAISPRRRNNKNIITVIENEYKKIGIKNLRISTDDGSVGYHGLVTELLADNLKNGLTPERDVTIFACGPYNMLKEVSRIAGDNKIDCQVLLEERMACGIGACLSCVCEVVGTDGEPTKKRVCRDGPVFNAAEIIWKS